MQKDIQRDIQKRQYRPGKKRQQTKYITPEEKMTTQEAPGIDNGEIREYRQAAEEQKNRANEAEMKE